jgi:hypothetical protein
MSKLQIVIEKKRMRITTYKQHLFFNVISLRRWWPSCLLGWCLRRAATLPAWPSPPSDRLDVGRWRSRCPPFRELVHPMMDRLTWQAMLTVHGQHFFVDILCCHIFCRQKPHNATLFYRGTRIQARRHLVTAAPSLQSCAYRSSRVTIKLDSAAI